MIKIAICDDDENTCGEIERMILEYEQKNGEDLSVDAFCSGERLITYLQAGNSFDLIFLDIEMGDISGVKVGRAIRVDMQDNIVQIVYISAKQGYAMELFKNRPLDFLIKPLKKEKIIASIEKTKKLTQNYNLFFEFFEDKVFHKIAYKDIVYFKSRNKKVIVATTQKEYECYGKLPNIANIVPKHDFIFIHQSYLVNFLYISESKYNTLLLTTNESLSISQTYRKAVRDTLLKRRKDMG